MTGPGEDPYANLDGGAIELADLSDVDASGLSLDVPGHGDAEGSFADARLDSLGTDDVPESGLGSGLGAGEDLYAAVDATPAPAPQQAENFELDQTADKAVRKMGVVAGPAAAQLQARGATGVAAIVAGGATPAGHKRRRHGLFSHDTVANILACVLIGLVLGILPARLVSASHLDQVGVEGALQSMTEAREHMKWLNDPERTEEGPQEIELVETALQDDVNAIDETAAEVDAAIVAAKSRYWMVWLGIGLPLGIALSFLRRG